MYATENLLLLWKIWPNVAINWWLNSVWQLLGRLLWVLLHSPLRCFWISRWSLASTVTLVFAPCLSNRGISSRSILLLYLPPPLLLPPLSRRSLSCCPPMELTLPPAKSEEPLVSHIWWPGLITSSYIISNSFFKDRNFHPIFQLAKIIKSGKLTRRVAE